MGDHDAKLATAKPATVLAKAAATAPKSDRAESYLREPKIAARLWHEIKAHLAKVDLPPAARSIWTDEQRFVSSTLEYLRPFELFLTRERLGELLFPSKPYDAVANVVPTKNTWEPAVGVALAPLFEEAILGSLRRLGPKWVALAENQPQPDALVDETKSLVAESSLIPSHPMDLAVRHGLATDGVIDLKAGVLPVAKRKKLRAQRQVKVHWEGARDRGLWNFVRPDPADATAEEVAAALFTNYFWRGDGAIYAHRLTKVGDLFGVPEGMARKFEGARAHAPEPGAEPKSRVLAGARSKTTDELARAEAGRQQLTAPMLRGILSDSVTVLRFLETELAPWKLAKTVAIGLAWVTSKQSSADAKLLPLAGVIVEQYALLQDIRAQVEPITKRELKEKERNAIHDPMSLYARAAASSHLASTSKGLLAAGQRKATDLVISSLRATAVDLSSATTYSDPSGHAKEYADTSRRLQTQLLQTGEADPQAVEETILGSQEVALEARLTGLYDQAKQLLVLANEAKSLWVVWHRRFDEVADIAGELESHVNFVRGVWSTGKLADQRGDSEHVRRQLLDNRRSSLERAQTEFNKLRQHKDVVDLLTNGIDVIKEHQSYVKWTKVLAISAAMIGLSFVASAAAARIGSAIAGRLIGAEIIQGAGLLARGGRILAAGVEVAAGPIADVAINSVGQVAIQGGSIKEAFVENGLQTIASTLILRKIGGSLELSKQLERQSVKLWSAQNRAGTAILHASVTIPAHIVINIATAYVARQITQRLLPVQAVGGESDALEEIFMQGASLAVGRLVHGKLEASKALDEKLAKHPKGGAIAERRRKLAQLADLAEKAPQSEHAVELLVELQALHHAEHALLTEIRDNPSAPDVGINRATAGGLVKNLAKSSDLSGAGFEVLPMHEAKLDEVLPGKHWKGPLGKIQKAIARAKKLFADTQVRQANGLWHVTINKREMILEERTLGAPAKVTKPVEAPTSSLAETRAELVPGSDFRGRSAGAMIDPATTLKTLQGVLRGQRNVELVERLYDDVTAKSDVRTRHAQTVLVRLAKDGRQAARNLTIRIETGPLEGLTVARSWVNSTQQGFTRVGPENLRVLGRHVIHVSNALAPIHAERAIAHEVAEILELDRLNFAGHYAKPDALRANSKSIELSPHDRGRLAEIEVLVRSTLGNSDLELHALVEHLGLRGGVDGASERLKLAKRNLSEKAAARLEEISAVKEGKELDAIRAKAQVDVARELTRAETRKQVGHDMPLLVDQNGKPLKTKEALAERAAKAQKERADKSDETWALLKAMQADHASGYPELPYQVMIGGGASLAARDRLHLLVDDRGRWQVDGNVKIAQTGNQLKHTADAKLGDPRGHVEPNERLPLDAVRAWEDEIAIQGPVLNGRATLKLSSKNQLLIELTVGTESRTFRLTSEPLVATGFVAEKIPGAPSGRPVDVVNDLKAAIDVLKADSRPDVRNAASAALVRLQSSTLLRNHETTLIREILGNDKHLLAALRDNPAANRALSYSDAARDWETIVKADDPDHPHVFFGDQANIGREQAMHSNNWVIAGTGGTSVSAAEIVLKNNKQANVVMVGTDSPAGLLENDQFRMLAEEHADAALAASMGLTRKTSRRLSIKQGYVDRPIAANRENATQKLVDESNIDPVIRSKKVYDINGTNKITGAKVRAEGTAYVASIGRNDDYPPVVLQLMDQVTKLKNGKYFIEPLFHDGQYVGYRVRFAVGNNTLNSLDVTGAATRFLPVADAKANADVGAIKKAGYTVDQAFKKVTDAADWDAPAESGNFAGGFAATATQAARYGEHRVSEQVKREAGK